MTEIFSNGGGTQSAAISALIVQGRLPKPDLVVICDTGREKSSTWDYLDAVIRPALRGVGLEVIRIKHVEWSNPSPSGEHYSHNGNTLLIPAFTNQSGDVGKLSGFCSNKWKVMPKNRYLREVLKIPTNQQKNWIGFSTDEARRAIRMIAGEDFQAGLIRLPLIHDVPMNRREAIALVESMGWPTPPRSSCYMCPNHNDSEWRDLKKNYPLEFEMACDLEREIQQKDAFCFFHKSCKPLNEVDFTLPEDLFDRACSSGGCFT